jgi:hypothetical protein
MSQGAAAGGGGEANRVSKLVLDLFGAAKDAAIALELENVGAGENNEKIAEHVTNCATWSKLLPERSKAAANLRARFNDLSNFDEIAAACALEDKPVEPSPVMLHDFRRSVWQVHHAGVPMPNNGAPEPAAAAAAGGARGKKRKKEKNNGGANGGGGGGEGDAEDADEELMVGDQAVATKCPLSLSLLEDPVMNVKCRHTFSRAALVSFVNTWNRRGTPNCPVVGCKEKINLNTVVADEQAAFAVQERMRNERSQAQANRRRAVDL